MIVWSSFKFCCSHFLRAGSWNFWAKSLALTGLALLIGLFKQGRASIRESRGCYCLLDELLLLLLLLLLMSMWLLFNPAEILFEALCPLWWLLLPSDDRMINDWGTESSWIRLLLWFEDDLCCCYCPATLARLDWKEALLRSLCRLSVPLSLACELLVRLIRLCCSFLICSWTDYRCYYCRYEDDDDYMGYWKLLLFLYLVLTVGAGCAIGCY